MFRVKCPICGGLLTIDERLRKVIGHVTEEEAAKKPEERLEAILGNIQKAKAEQESKLQAAKEREARRLQHAEELFRKAQEKARESEDDRPDGPTFD